MFLLLQGRAFHMVPCHTTSALSSPSQSSSCTRETSTRTPLSHHILITETEEQLQPLPSSLQCLHSPPTLPWHQHLSKLKAEWMRVQVSESIHVNVTCTFMYTCTYTYMYVHVHVHVHTCMYIVVAARSLHSMSAASANAVKASRCNYFVGSY